MKRYNLRQLIGTASVAVAVTAIVAGGLLLTSGDSVAQEPLPAGDVYKYADGDPDRAYRPVLPVPDASRAVDTFAGREALLVIPGMAAVIRAIELGDFEAFLALTETAPQDCAALGRSAGPNCEVRNGAADGVYQAVTFQGGGSTWRLSESRTRLLLDALFATGTPRLSFTSIDTRTPDGPGGTYFVAFEGLNLDTTDLDVSLGNNTVSGLALTVRPGSDLPIVALSPLLPDWGPLKEAQLQDPAHHRLLFPESLDGLERVYDHYEREYERSLQEYVGP